MKFFQKLCILISIFVLNSVYSESPQTTHRIEQKFLLTDNRCQEFKTVYFQFTNNFTGEQYVRYDINPKFNVDTDMPIRNGSVSLPQGDSIVYKNTYTSKTSIITGAAILQARKSKDPITLCSLSLFYFEDENSCQTGLSSIGPKCVFAGGEGKNNDPYIISLGLPWEYFKI